MAEGDTLISVDYEIFGKVQGVFFRKYTQVCGLPTLSAWEQEACSRKIFFGEAGSLVTEWQRGGLWKNRYENALQWVNHNASGSFSVCVHAQSCPTLQLQRLYSLPGSSVHGIFPGRILEWVAISSSRGSSPPRSLALAGGFFYHWVAWESLLEALSAVIIGLTVVLSTNTHMDELLFHKERGLLQFSLLGHHQNKSQFLQGS